MVIQAGSLQITGTIDIQNIKSGLMDMKREMQKAKGDTGGLFGDIIKLGKEAGFTAKKFALLGVGILGSLTGLAIAFGPSSQVAMERFRISAEQIGISVDRIVGPALNSLADIVSGLVPLIDDAVNRFQDFKGATIGFQEGFLGAPRVGEFETGGVPPVGVTPRAFGGVPGVGAGGFGGGPRGVAGFGGTFEPFNLNRFIEESVATARRFLGALEEGTGNDVSIQANNVIIQGGGQPAVV